MADSNAHGQHKRSSVTFEFEGSKSEDVHGDTKLSEEASLGMKPTDDAPVDVQGNTDKSM